MGMWVCVCDYPIENITFQLEGFYFQIKLATEWMDE